MGSRELRQGICDELPQTMSADRQLELTRAATLAHFRGDAPGPLGSAALARADLSARPTRDVMVQVEALVGALATAGLRRT